MNKDKHNNIDNAIIHNEKEQMLTDFFCFFVIILLLCNVTVQYVQYTYKELKIKVFSKSYPQKVMRDCSRPSHDVTGTKRESVSVIIEQDVSTKKTVKPVKLQDVETSRSFTSLTDTRCQTVSVSIEQDL